MTKNESQPESASQKSPSNVFDTTLVHSSDTLPASGSRNSAAGLEWVGRTIGRYKVISVLGVGGMGVVLKGRDDSIERDVAVKVLIGNMAQDAVAMGRFLAEAKAAGKINHPNVVTVYEIAQDGPTHFIALELVAGGSAAEELNNKGPYSVAEATRIIIEACSGLAAAHRAGMIHRDIKPANLLLAEDRTVKVADFGLARLTANNSMQMTQVGQLLGTPYFMSPEQCESSAVDHRSDIYSLGATYYSLLVDKNPYEDSVGVMNVLYAHCHADAPNPRDVMPQVPEACAAVIRRAMAKEPIDRYQSAADMNQDLQAILAALSGASVVLPSQSGMNLPRMATSAAGNPVGSGAMNLAETPTSNTSTSKPISRRTWIGLAALAATAGGGAFALISKKSNNDVRPGDSGFVPLPTEGVKVGILHSLSGTMLDSESPIVDAILLAIEEVNQAGGVLGKPIVPVVADGRSSDAVFAKEAQRLIDVEKVATVFGCWTSSSRKSVLPIFESANHLLIYPVQYEGLEESPNIVYTGAVPNQQILPAVEWAFETLGKRSFYLVGSDYVFPRVANEIIKDRLKELGLEVAGESYLPLGTRKVQDVVDQLVAAKPDVILNTINGDTNQELIRALREKGIHPDNVPVISFSIGEAELRHLNGDEVAGDFAAWNYFQTIDSPENVEFVQRFKAKYGPQRVVTDPMEAAWIGMKLWANAVNECQSVEPPVIARAMRNQRMRAAEGEVRVDAGSQHLFKTPRIGRIQADGQFEIVWTADAPIAPRPYPKSRTSAQWHALLSDLYNGWGEQWSAPK